MAGLDDVFVDVGIWWEVVYVNFVFGQYIFQVWGVNNEDIWSIELVILKIIISFFWWVINWVYFLYLGLFFILFYVVYCFQVNWDCLKIQLVYEQCEVECFVVLDWMKFNFFFNIIYEF